MKAIDEPRSWYAALECPLNRSSLSVHSNLQGLYVENSCLDEFLRNPAPFGVGPFVLSEYSLAEKAALAWPEFVNFLDRAQALMQFLRVPPVTQVLTGNLDPRWNGPIELIAIDVEEVRAGRRHAVEKLDTLKSDLAASFRRRYAELRPHWADYLSEVSSGKSQHLLDPRKPSNAREIVAAATLESLGASAAPSLSDPLPDRIAWTMRAWEMAMVFVRLERERDNEKDLRNDPIDAVHFTLAATFCEGIAIRDKGMRRIYALMPEPKILAHFLEVDGELRALSGS